MKEKTLKKIKKLLAKEGLEEDRIDSIVEELEATEEGGEEENPAPIPEDGGDPTASAEQGDPIPPEVSDEVPPESEGEVPVEEEVPPEVPSGPAPGSIEDALANLVPPEGEVPPVEEQVPPTPQVPPIDPGQIQDLLGQLDELKKANEGLLARVDSLEEALKNAGVLEGSQQEVGDERPNLPPSDNGQGAILDDILNQINNGGR